MGASWVVLFGWAGLASAEPLTPATAAHERVDCHKCHFGAADASAKPVQDRCVGCHSRAHVKLAKAAVAVASPALSGAPGLGRDCTSCHLFHAPETVRTGAGDLDLKAAAQVDRGHCVACHTKDGAPTRLNPAHLQAAMLYHGESATLAGTSASQGCINCHDRGSDSVWQTSTSEAPLTFLTHATHPYGVRVVPGSGTNGNRIRRELDPRIPLFGGRMECQSCHSLTAGTEDLLLAFSSPKELCLGCHVFKDEKDLPESSPRVKRPALMATVK